MSTMKEKKGGFGWTFDKERLIDNNDEIVMRPG